MAAYKYNIKQSVELQAVDRKLIKNVIVIKIPEHQRKHSQMDLVQVSMHLLMTVSH